MRSFAALYADLDATTKTTRKIAALRRYFREASPADSAWAIYFLSGRKLNRLLPMKLLRKWCQEVTGIDEWLFDECYERVGDLAETMALLLDTDAVGTPPRLAVMIEERLSELRGMSEPAQRELVVDAWRELNADERFVFNKLLTGSFRVGVSQRLVARSLADEFQVPVETIAHRMMGTWQPTPTFLQRLVDPDTTDTDVSRPYPFCLAHPHEGDPANLGPASDFVAQWKWDGIRAQLIRRAGECHLWSRGEDIIWDRFPELHDEAVRLPDGVVLDGEIVALRDGEILPFAQLQRRIGRKTVGKKILADVPAVMLCFDLLEDHGEDIRALPLVERRRRLERVFAEHQGLSAGRIRLATEHEAATWEQLAVLRDASRDHAVEGLMLKRKDSSYGVGRTTGLWWKWKIAPHTIDAVMTYAQRGHGRRASLYTDYTFGVWDEGKLVTFAKAYSGLTDEEIKQVDRWIRQHMRARFGPVCEVEPELVFELAFENIQRSTRHKAGIAVRFPRIVRWRHDKKPADADSLDQIKALLPPVADTLPVD